MHWPSYERGTWGIILAIAAILLAFPLSLLANLVTPAIRNWWANRSVATLKIRLATLERDLQKRQSYPLFSEGEETILLAIRRTVFIGMNFVSLSLALPDGWLLHFQHKLSPEVIAINILVGVLAAGNAAYMSVPIDLALELRSRSARTTLEKNIAKLKAKLPAS